MTVSRRGFFGIFGGGVVAAPTLGQNAVSGAFSLPSPEIVSETWNSPREYFGSRQTYRDMYEDLEVYRVQIEALKSVSPAVKAGLIRARRSELSDRDAVEGALNHFAPELLKAATEPRTKRLLSMLAKRMGQ